METINHRQGTEIMLQEPKELTTEIYAELPSDLRLEDRESAFTKDLMRGLRVGSFLEGPSFDRQGNLLMVDIAHGRILKLSPGRDWSVLAQYDGQPNGLKVHADGRIFVADRANGIVIVDPISGAVETFLGPDRLPGYKGLNDLFFASNGDLYFTDQGATGLHDPSGRLFSYRADGSIDCLLNNIPSPNGLVMSPNEDELYLAVTRASAVWRVPFRESGEVHRVGIYCQLPGGGGPDGMAVDSGGNLIVAHAGMGCVSVFSANPRGLPLYHIRACDGGLSITNIAFGGPENKTLFITNSSNQNVLTAKMPLAGHPMFSHN